MLKIYNLLFLEHFKIKQNKKMKKSILFSTVLFVALIFSKISFAQYTDYPLNDNDEGGLKFPRASYDISHPVWFFSLRDNNQDLWLYSLNPDNKDNDEFWNAIKLNYSSGKSIELNGATTINGQTTINGIGKIDGGSSFATLWLNSTGTVGNRLLFQDANGGNYLTSIGGTNGYLTYGGAKLYNNGSVGINTTTPSSTNKLTVNGKSEFQDDLSVTGYNKLIQSGNNYFGFTPVSGWSGFKLDGTEKRLILGVDGGQTRNVFDIERTDTWEHMLELRADGSAYFKGAISIGTTNATHKLNVNGTIRANEIIVETGWADFVFEKDYNLKPLSEVEQFVNENKHLPDVPSAQEVSENGVSLGAMQSTLLQKVEELTLYVIEQNKRIEKLEKENAELKK